MQQNVKEMPSFLDDQFTQITKPTTWIIIIVHLKVLKKYNFTNVYLWNLQRDTEKKCQIL